MKKKTAKISSAIEVLQASLFRPYVVERVIALLFSGERDTAERAYTIVKGATDNPDLRRRVEEYSLTLKLSSTVPESEQQAAIAKLQTMEIDEKFADKLVWMVQNQNLVVVNALKMFSSEVIVQRILAKFSAAQTHGKYNPQRDRASQYFPEILAGNPNPYALDLVSRAANQFDDFLVQRAALRALGEWKGNAKPHRILIYILCDPNPRRPVDFNFEWETRKAAVVGLRAGMNDALAEKLKILCHSSLYKLDAILNELQPGWLRPLMGVWVYRSSSASERHRQIRLAAALALEGQLPNNELIKLLMKKRPKSTQANEDANKTLQRLRQAGN